MMMVMLMMHHDHDEDDDDDDDGDGDDDGKKVGSKPPACLRSVHNFFTLVDAFFINEQQHLARVTLFDFLIDFLIF